MSEKSLKQISDGKPLYDEHISFAEKLLKQQFPTLDGLQSPLLSQNNGFSPVQDESIQIHHTGMFHWVTSTSIGGNVQLFDSMFKGGGLSSLLQIQLAQIYKALIKEEDDDKEEGHTYKYLEVKVPAVQGQSGVKDCGVFAIAFAYHAARGDDLSKMRFHQERLRPHLVQCFKKKRLEPFPHTTLETPYTHSFFPYMEIEVYCDCNMPEVYDNMIACDKCEEWFHFSCAGLKSPPEFESQWCCSKCYRDTGHRVNRAPSVDTRNDNDLCYLGAPSCAQCGCQILGGDLSCARNHEPIISQSGVQGLKFVTSD